MMVLIGKFRKWGCDAFKYWDIFQVAVQLILSNVEQNGRVIDRHIFIKNIPPEPFESFMMVFSVPISLQIPLKLPDVCLMENSPFSKTDFISNKSEICLC
jgi:hypothetical protein